MENDTRNEEAAAAVQACGRGLAWGLALMAVGGCLLLVAPLPMPVPEITPARRILSIYWAIGGLSYAGLAILVGYAARLAPHVWGRAAGRSRLRTWGLRILGALTVWPWVWGLALLVPAARRRGDRRGAWLAGAGGALAFAAEWGFRIKRLNAEGTPLGWGLYVLLAVAFVLLWRALRRLEGGRSRALHGAGWGLVLAGLLAVAALPGWRVPGMAARADALTASILADAGYADASAPLAAGRPPVAAEDDPLAAIDSDALAAERADWNAFYGPYCRTDDIRQLNPPQLEAADVEAIDAWFAAHPAFTAFADALSTPGYRSCLPGISKREEISLVETGRLEPRLREGGASTDWIAALALRARAACARGDIPAALGDIRRLDVLADLNEREPWAICKLVSRVPIYQIVRCVLGERLDLWDDASLAALGDILEARVRATAGLFAQAVAVETIGCEATLPLVGGGWCPDLFRNPMRTPYDGKYARWFLAERIAYAGHARRALDTAAAIAALPPGPVRAAAWQAFRDEKHDENDLSMAAAILTPSYDGFFRKLVLSPETSLGCFRIAAAVARWHREHGTLPDTLDALVPGYLPAVPLEAAGGEPPVWEPAEDGKSFTLGGLDSHRKEGKIRFFLAPPAAGEGAETPAPPADLECPAKNESLGERVEILGAPETAGTAKTAGTPGKPEN